MIFKKGFFQFELFLAQLEIDAADFKLGHDLAGEGGERLGLLGRESARLGIHDAERTQGIRFAGGIGLVDFAANGSAREKPDLWAARHEVKLGKALILSGIFNGEDAVVLQHVIANGVVAGEFRDVTSDAGFYPEAVGIHETALG